MTRRPSPSAGGPRPGERRPADPKTVSADVDDRLRAIVATAQTLPLSERIEVANDFHRQLDERRFRDNPPPDYSPQRPNNRSK